MRIANERTMPPLAMAPGRRFTLVEMLIVIAIIAILMALLAPTLRRSLAAARDVECANNMHQLAVAQLSYCSDHRGRFEKARNTSGVNWAIEWMWQDMLLPYTYEHLTERWDYDYQKYPNYWQRPRVWQTKVDFGGDKYVYVPIGIFACPAITKDQRRSRVSSKGLRWYIGMNLELIKPPTNLRKVIGPESTIMFSDMMHGGGSDNEFAGNTIGTNNNNAAFWYEPSYGNPDLPYRHGQGGRYRKGNNFIDGGFNVACVQGNVRYVPRVLMPESAAIPANGKYEANKKAEVKFYKEAFVK